MKKLALTISLLAGATVGYAQGTLNWSDYQSANAAAHLPAFYIEIFSPGPNGAEQNLGNTGNDLPAGGATYAGTALGTSGTGTGPTGYGNGANYEVGLYVGATASAAQNAVSSGAPIATDHFLSGALGGSWDIS